MVQYEETFDPGVIPTTTPQFVQSGYASSDINATVTLGSPPSIGNLLLMFGGGTTQGTWANPTGFTRQAWYRAPASDGRNRCAGIWTRVVDGSEGSTFILAGGGGYPTNTTNMALYEISQTDVSKIVSVGAGTTGSIGSTTVSTSSTTGASNALGMCVFVDTQGTVGTISPVGYLVEKVIGSITHNYESPVLFALGNVPSGIISLTGVYGLYNPAAYAFIVLPSTVPASSTGSQQFVTDELLIKISQLAKFAAIRKEFFNMGYYKNGDQPSTPISPIDNSDIYANELLYLPMFVSSGPVGSGFIPGQVGFPRLDPFLHGRELVCPYENYFDWENGKQVTTIYAFDTGHVNSATYEWGASLVFAVGQRLSVQYQNLLGAIGRAGMGSAGGGGGGIAPGTSSVSGGSTGAGTSTTSTLGGTADTGSQASGLLAPTTTFIASPTSLGGFTITHGLTSLQLPPQQVTVEMETDGEITYLGYDATYLYLRASCGGIQGIVSVWANNVA
jgi:hypothetical protein